MSEYVITIRVRTEREPRDDLNWASVADTLKALFKARPTTPIEVLGMAFQQVARGEQGHG